MRRKIVTVIAVLGGVVFCSGSAVRASGYKSLGADAKVEYSANGRVKAVGKAAVQAPPGISDPGEAARWFLREHRALFGLDAPGLRTKQKEVHHHLDQYIVHFSLTLDDLPVFFRRVVVQVDSKNLIRRVFADIPDIESRRDSHQILGARAMEDWAAGYGYPLAAIVGQGWLATKSRSVRPVIKIDTLEMSSADPQSLFVDVSNGRIMHAEPVEWTMDPLGAVFPENPATTPEIEVVPIRYLDNRTDRLEGAYARAATCVDKEECKDVAPLALLSSEGNWNFIYKPLLGEYTFDDPFAEVNAYHNVSTINAWVRDSFGWEGKFGDNTWIQVKVGRAWYNAAYYAGNEERDPFIIFGQDIVDFAYDSDVAYHEFGHAVNRTLWEHPWAVGDEFGLDASMSGIEEAFADIWAEHLSGDPVMNSYILAARTADNNLTCPDAVVSEGHYEARILTGFAWDVREEIGETAWGHIVFRTLSFLDSYVRFDDFVAALAQSAEDLAEEGSAGSEPENVDVILKLGEERGFRDEECLKRIVPMVEGQARRVYGYGRKRTGKLDYPFGLQWKIAAPAGAEAAKIFFKWRYPTEEDVEGVRPGFKAHIRRGAPVEITWLDFETLEEGDQAFEATADITLTEAPVSVDFPYLGLEPLSPGETLYVLISSATEEPIVVIDSAVYFLPKLQLPPGVPDEEEPDSGPEMEQDLFSVADNFSCTALNPHTSAGAGRLMLAILGILLDI
jgi:hypothetical protein